MNDHVPMTMTRMSGIATRIMARARDHNIDVNCDWVGGGDGDRRISVFSFVSENLRLL